MLVTSVFLQITLIDRVHKIYNDTTWRDESDVDGFNGMGFVIKKILVHKKPKKVRFEETHYNMIRDKWDVKTLLEVSYSICSLYLKQIYALLTPF